MPWPIVPDHFPGSWLHQDAASVCRKDPHGFFAFPVTDAIAPGYSMIIKHPMDFGTMKEKIVSNEYKSITEFKVTGHLLYLFWHDQGCPSGPLLQALPACRGSEKGVQCPQVSSTASNPVHGGSLPGS